MRHTEALRRAALCFRLLPFLLCVGCRGRGELPSAPSAQSAAARTAVACGAAVPEEVRDALRRSVEEQRACYSWEGDAARADIRLDAGRLGEAPAGSAAGAWSYVVAAPFFTVEDEVRLADIRSAWEGLPRESMAGHNLLVTQDTAALVSLSWGKRSSATVSVLPAGDLLPRAERTGAYAILPFHRLEPRWKVLRVDGISPLAKGGDQAAYPLHVSFSFRGTAAGAASDALAVHDASNRREEEMTVLVMTGVTAMARGTGRLMDWRGVTYPARDIASWFRDADFVHVNNEAAFCAEEPSASNDVLSSRVEYISLLEAIRANVIELTGSHLLDRGAKWLDLTLEMYRARGWQWYGGGSSRSDAARPLCVEHGPNRIAFLGCSLQGPGADEWGGANGCDLAALGPEIARLREQGYLPVVTIQHVEEYRYAPSEAQIRDFRGLAEAGAVWVQGSQAHQPQTMEFHGAGFIHYGLGNLFFDQMWSTATRQAFVDRLVFYQGRLLSIELRTTILEEYGRPRPMTVGDAAPEADRDRFLRMIFSLRPRS